MPRIARNIVTFVVDGKEWKAQFSHQHAKDKDGGVAHHRPDGKSVLVQHITTCRLSVADKPKIWLTGISLCSLKDKYQWKRGIRRSFQQCLEKAQWCKFAKEERTNRLTGQKEMVEVVLGLRPIYGQIMKAFFEELPKKTYWPHDPSAPKAPKPVPGPERVVIEGEVIKSEVVVAGLFPPPIPAEMPPASTRNGTAHLGMD